MDNKSDFLKNISSPGDLKKLKIEDLQPLAQEVRDRIIEVVSKTGGHLASSLGAVELAVAVHYCFNAPKDHIIWDVGHQAYAHKILTGRNVNFDTLRQKGGISGFPSKFESAYDPFCTGHSSTAVSLAVGLAAGRSLEKRDEKVVAIIGDGSLTGGMCFEALNHAGHLGRDLMVVLNSNDMAIAPSVGALSTYLNKLISKPVYNRFKEARQRFLKQRLPRIGPRLLKLVDRFEEMLKGLIVPGIFFEEMGFQYFGPLDGHNIPLMVETIKNISSLKGPLLLHVVTKKGKGFTPAEEAPVKFHGTPCFDISSGKVIVPKNKEEVSFTEAFSCKLLSMAQTEENIVAVTAAMSAGTGLNKLAESFPERFFDVGIAEGHAIAFAAGLAKSGFKPYAAIYSTFLQRSYDQIIEEVCLQNLGVVLCIDRAGVVGEDGPTHHGIFDIAYLRHLPNLTLMAPADKDDLESMLEFAQRLESPSAIRYPKDIARARSASLPFSTVKQGKSEILREGRDVTILALGSMVYPAIEAAEILANRKLHVGVVNARFIKPLDDLEIANLYRQSKSFLVLEEGVINGGFGSAVLESLQSTGVLEDDPKPIKFLGLPSEFISYDSRQGLLEKYGLSAKAIAETAHGLIR